jgi:long-chain acyl-CoA synthetase
MSGRPEPRTLVHALEARATEKPHEPAIRTLVEGGAERAMVWTWSEWRDDSARVARALRSLGVGRTDRVAILADAVPMWPVVDLGVQWAGAVSVGLYPTSAPAQVVELLSDCAAHVAFAGSRAHYETLVAVAPQLPDLDLIVRADGVDARDAGAVRQRSMAEFLDGSPSGGSPPEPPDDPDADAILIYTSGSTGTPRGARLSHRTLVASARSIRDSLGLVSGDRALSFLPYCHAAERIFGLATRLVVGMECGMVLDPGRVFEAAAAFRPTLFGGLPRFFEKIHEAELVERGPDATPPSPVVSRLTGGSVRLATSGGASLPTEVAEGLDRLGLTVLGAYGLTEHLCVALNHPGNHRFDDVGTAMPGTEIRIAEDGEILVKRSDLTFSGYHARPDATRAAFTADGEWLRTGDLGELDEQGRLRVTGRKKELIALSTGKKVAPIRIEAALVAQPWIEHAVLVGEGRKFVAALLTLRRRVVEVWAEKQGLTASGPSFERDPRVVAEVARQVETVNARLSRTESVRKFVVLPESFSTEAGELTPTHKLRREVVLDRFADRVDGLYAAAEAGAVS